MPGLCPRPGPARPEPAIRVAGLRIGRPLHQSARPEPEAIEPGPSPDITTTNILTLGYSYLYWRIVFKWFLPTLVKTS